MPKPRNIIIFVTIGLVVALVYFFFIKGPSDPEGALVSSVVEPTSTVTGTSAPEAGSIIASDFLALLLNVKNIKLNDSIFSEISFKSLRDSSIILTPDGNEGRPNPFAPIGTDIILTPPPPPTGFFTP